MQNFNEQQRARLAELLDFRASDAGSMRSDEVQAYMLALVSGPDEVKPEQWLPEILDEVEFSEAEQNEIRELVQALADDMAGRLKTERKLPELWFYQDEEGETDYFTWCNAYLYALDTVETDWFERADNEEFEDSFYPLMALAGVYDEDSEGGALLELSERELAQLKKDLPDTLLDIALFWQAVLNKPQTVRREGGKVGRNDPCPCGSGKKFKACCGKN
ncbi:MAG: YecA family protein [Neisseria sp.]|nr:YecA family protein [Neisseria sp.]